MAFCGDGRSTLTLGVSAHHRFGRRGGSFTRHRDAAANNKCASNMRINAGACWYQSRRVAGSVRGRRRQQRWRNAGVAA